MRTLDLCTPCLALVALLLVGGAGHTAAQARSSAAAAPTIVAAGPDAGGAAASGGKGASGWTGGHPAQSDQPGDSHDSPAGQPFMATGLDLKGPPVQFKPSQTPE